jgi:hypothetical protein
MVHDHELRTAGGTKYVKAINDGRGGVSPVNLPPYIPPSNLVKVHSPHSIHPNFLLKRKEEVSRAT